MDNEFKWFKRIAGLVVLCYAAIIGFIVWVVIKVLQHFKVI